MTKQQQQLMMMMMMRITCSQPVEDPQQQHQNQQNHEDRHSGGDIQAPRSAWETSGFSESLEASDASETGADLPGASVGEEEKGLGEELLSWLTGFLSSQRNSFTEESFFYQQRVHKKCLFCLFVHKRDFQVFETTSDCCC